MSIELSNHGNGRDAQISAGENADESKETLMLWGGAALVLLGAGMILSTPSVRETLGGVNLASLVGAALPKDVQRYMRLRSM